MHHATIKAIERVLVRVTVRGKWGSAYLVDILVGSASASGASTQQRIGTLIERERDILRERERESRQTSSSLASKDWMLIGTLTWASES